MKRIVFPYGIRFQEDGRMDIFPAAEIFVLGKAGKGIRALFHMDSGATTSILPVSDAEVLGISLKNKSKVVVRGIGGDAMMGFQHSIKIQLMDSNIKIPVIFVEEASVPRILGREGVFTLFGILFDESRKRTAFLDAKQEKKTIDSLFN